MTMLQFADANAPCLGDVYNGMDTMVEKVKFAIQKHENDPIECETLCDKVESIIHHHWEKMTTSLHLLAYALSSRYYSKKVLSMLGGLAPYRDEEVANGYKKAFERLFPNEEVQKKVRTKFGLFSSGRFHSPTTINDQYNVEIVTWWYLHGQPFRFLQPLAIKILSQVASSFAAEWNWNTYSFIHSMKCNRLGSKKAKDLVFIPCKLCLVSCKDPNYKDGAAKHWDVAPECANVDATIEDLTRLTTTYDDNDYIPTHGASGTALG